MALPFIVGPHQCSLTQGPDGRPQVEVVLRIRLPLAEFFDALLLTLAEQHPLFPQGGRELDPATIAPVKAGLLAKERSSPPAKEEASPKRKTAGRIQPKKPAHPPMQVPPADPTHEKLLAVLSQAAQLPDTEERGGATASADPPLTHPGGMAKPPTLAPANDWPPRQATSSRLPAQQCITQGNVHYRVAEDGAQEHLPPPRAFAHPKKCPVQ